MSVIQNCLIRLSNVRPMIRLISKASYFDYSNRTFSSESYLCTSKPMCFNNQLLPAVTVNTIQRRFKKGRKSNQYDEKGNDELSDDEDGVEENPLLMDEETESTEAGSERVVIDVGSLRLDAFAKIALGGTRAKIEELFYKGDIYVNSERPSKKSYDLSIGDEIDLVKQVNPEDRSKLDIKRVRIVKLPDKTNEQGRIKVTIDRWQDLTIDAYEKSDQ